MMSRFNRYENSAVVMFFDFWKILIFLIIKHHISRSSVLQNTSYSDHNFGFHVVCFQSRVHVNRHDVHTRFMLFLIRLPVPAERVRAKPIARHVFVDEIKL